MNGRQGVNRPALTALMLFALLALPAVGAGQEEPELVDQLVDQAFVQAFGTAPAGISNARRIGSATAVERSPRFEAAVAVGRSAVASPSDSALLTEFADRLGSLIGSDNGDNVLEILYLVLRESVSETSEAKKYWLKRLSEQNEMSEQVSAYLQELSRAGQELGDRATAAATVPITARIFDPVWLDTLVKPPAGKRATVCDPCMATREATLNAEQIQREQESMLGVQRRLLAGLEETRAREGEIERRTAGVVGMLAEVLRKVDQETGGPIRRAVVTTGR